MTTTSLYALWAAMFFLCGGLGFIPEATGFLKVLLILLAAGFFIPGFVILKKGTEKDGKRILKLSVISLSATFLLIILNILSLMAPTVVGDILYGALTVISAPMLCGQYWVISLFLWACLLLAALRKGK